MMLAINGGINMSNKANRMREIADEIADLVGEAKNIARTTEGIFFDHYNEYVFK